VVDATESQALAASGGPHESATSIDSLTVTVVVPVLNEAEHIARCLDAIYDQSYSEIVEILVVDGGSTDDTPKIALAHAAPAGSGRVPLRHVRVVDNPKHSRPAAMNVALNEAAGEIIVRVDARTVLAPTYVERCVEAIESSTAAIVGGPMRLSASTARERGIRAAMTSRIGGGPAQFRRVGEGGPRMVDTVYLGAFRREVVVGLGGYDETFGGNEDAELAVRAQRAGGVLLDPAIVSTYAVRPSLKGLASQYVRYGRARAGTIRKHPSSVAPRQLAVPLLMVGLLSPWRRRVLGYYGALVAARSVAEAVRDPAAAPTMALALPVMHASWGVGFVRGILRRG